MADKHVAVIGDNCYKYVTVYLTVLKSKGVIVPIDKELPVYDIINVLDNRTINKGVVLSLNTNSTNKLIEILELKQINFDKGENTYCGRL